jgi:hypothetical protein
VKTVFSEWKGYRQQVMPPACSPVQEQETKRAFYAGAACMFYLITGIPLSDGDEVADADIAAMARVKSEIDDYYQRMKEGKE